MVDKFGVGALTPPTPPIPPTPPKRAQHLVLAIMALGIVSLAGVVIFLLVRGHNTDTPIADANRTDAARDAPKVAEASEPVDARVDAPAPPDADIKPAPSFYAGSLISVVSHGGPIAGATLRLVGLPCDSTTSQANGYFAFTPCAAANQASHVTAQYKLPGPTSTWCTPPIDLTAPPRLTTIVAHECDAAAFSYACKTCKVPLPLACPACAANETCFAGRCWTTSPRITVKPPEYVAFGPDSHARYRLYEDVTVAAGQLRVDVHNQHPSDPVDFEVWHSHDGATIRVHAGGSRSEHNTGPLDNIERLVWYGHTTFPSNAGGWNRSLPGAVGWHLEFLRID